MLRFDWTLRYAVVMQIASLRRRVPIAFVRLLSSDFSAAVQLFGDRHRPRLADQRRRPSGECRNRSGSPHSSGGLASGSLPPRLLQSLSTRHPNCPYGSAIRSRKRYFSLYLCPLYHSHSLHSSLPPSLPPILISMVLDPLTLISIISILAFMNIYAG